MTVDNRQIALAVAGSVLTGTVLGGALQFAIQEPPQVNLLVLAGMVLCGAICAAICVITLSKLAGLPEGLYFKRFAPAGFYGAVIGVCSFGIWWSFLGEGWLLLMGAITGLGTGIPTATSYNQNDVAEYRFESVTHSTLATNILMGSVIAGGLLISALSEFDLDESVLSFLPGIAGLSGLIPTLRGGRKNWIDFFR